MKPSWLSKHRAEFDQGLEQLGLEHKVRSLNFTVWPTRITTEVFWIPLNEILVKPDVVGTVTNISRGETTWVTDYTDQEGKKWGFFSEMVVVAAGVWCDKLLSCPTIVGKKGASFRWITQLERNFIVPWAPYKQVVGFNDSERTCWVGDGTAILEKNWDKGRVNTSIERCAKAARTNPATVSTKVGIRPFVKDTKGPCLLEERSSGLWLATGGGKNGTIAAGWAASEIVKRTS